MSDVIRLLDEKLEAAKRGTYKPVKGGKFHNKDNRDRDNRSNYRNMFMDGEVETLPLRKVLRVKHVRDVSSDVIERSLRAHMTEFSKELRKYYKEGQCGVLEDTEEIVDILSNKKFINAFKEVIMEMIEDAENREDKDISLELMLYMLSDTFTKNIKSIIENKKVVKTIIDIFSAKYKNEIKKVYKLTGVDKEDVLKLMIVSQIYPMCPSVVLRDQMSNFNVYLCRLLATNEDTEINEKLVKKIIRTVYGEDLEQYILQTLLQTKPRNNDSAIGEIDSLITNVVLDILEKMDFDDRKSLLKTYYKRKLKKKNPSRIKLSNVNDEDYPNINKTIERLVDNGCDRFNF